MGISPWQVTSSLLESEFWLSWAPVMTVRGDLGLAFLLPFEAPRRKQWTAAAPE